MTVNLDSSHPIGCRVDSTPRLRVVRPHSLVGFASTPAFASFLAQRKRRFSDTPEARGRARGIAGARRFQNSCPKSVFRRHPLRKDDQQDAGWTVRGFGAVIRRAFPWGPITEPAAAAC